MPKLFPVNSYVKQARLIVEGGPKLRTQMIYNVERIAVKVLDDAYAALAAKRVGGVVAKAIMADQIRQKNEALGDIAWIE